MFEFYLRKSSKKCLVYIEVTKKKIFYFSSIFLFFVRCLTRNKHIRCVFVCFDVHTTALNHGFQVMCMFDSGFFYSYVLHLARTYIHLMRTRVKKRVRERERAKAKKKSNTSTKPRSLSLCMYMCNSFCILPRLFISSSLSFGYYRRKVK
jgi:hypothetical protein